MVCGKAVDTSRRNASGGEVNTKTLKNSHKNWEFAENTKFVVLRGGG
jgi:hypothetical protein